MYMTLKTIITCKLAGLMILKIHWEDSLQSIPIKGNTIGIEKDKIGIGQTSKIVLHQKNLCQIWKIELKSITKYLQLVIHGIGLQVNFENFHT